MNGKVLKAHFGTQHGLPWKKKSEKRIDEKRPKIGLKMAIKKFGAYGLARYCSKYLKTNRGWKNDPKTLILGDNIV
jgi:hypothetical protein